MSNKLRVSFVGCGGMAAHYLNVYRDLDWVRVVNCVDTQLENAQRAAEVLVSDAPIATKNYSAALGEDVDVVVISSPNHVHAEQAIAAIEAGKHVLLQKPVAATLADADAIARAASKSARTTGLYMSYFDQPLMHDVRDMVAAGRLGSIVNCYARLMHRGGMMWSREALEGKPNWRVSAADTGGGCFIQLAVHYIHIFEWMTGARVVRATGFANRLHCPGVEGEDVASAILLLDSGGVVTIDTAWCANGEELSLHGTAGRAEYRYNRWLAVSSAAGDYDGRAVHYSGKLIESAWAGPEGEEQVSEIVRPAFGDAANPLNQHRLFLEAVRVNKPAPVSIESGVRDMRIVAAVYESARTGRAVDVR